LIDDHSESEAADTGDQLSDSLILELTRQMMLQNAAQFVRAIESRTSLAASEALYAIRQFLVRGATGDQLPEPVAHIVPSLDRLECYAPIWGSVMPGHAELRGVTSLLLERRCGVDLATLPKLSAALSVDDPEVVAARADFSDLVPDAEEIEDMIGQHEHSAEGLAPSELELAVERDIQFLQLSKGDVLCRQGDAGGSFYLLLSGRLTMFVADDTGQDQLFSEIGPGETAGETEMLTGEPRPATIRALRDSTVITLDNGACQRLIERHPRFLLAVTHVVIRRLRDVRTANPHSRLAGLRTITVLPLTPAVPAQQFAARLAEAFAPYGAAAHISRESAETSLEEGGEYTLVADTYDDRLISWVNEQEARYRFVVYQAEPEVNAWTKRCLRQADRVLLVGLSSDTPELTHVEQEVAERAAGSLLENVELVLLHDPAVAHPSGTDGWLERRRVYDHHHLRLDSTPDYGYLVRRLTGRAIGVVLGGGGARAFASIGAFQAIDEFGLPVDMIGGTSGGSFIAACYALGWDRQKVIDVVRDTMGSRRQTLDYTFPLVSLMSAGKMKRTLQSLFGGTRIEDLWRPFFCITSNITRAEMMVHRRGLLWHYVRASCSIPTVFPPVLDGNDLLVDGMLLNNLPVEVMSDLSRGGPVIAIDVSSKEDVVQDFQFPASLSAAQAVFGRFNPRKDRRVKAPSILHVVLRTSEVASIYARKVQAKRATVYVSPAVAQFGVFETNALDQLVQIGYDSTKAKLAEWLERSSEARSYVQTALAV